MAQLITRRQGSARASRKTRPAGGILTALVAMFLAVSPVLSRGQETPAPRHSDLEAVFLFHFTQFVEWPTNAFAATNSPFVIGILGDHPVGAALRDVIRGETVRGRELVLRVFRHPDEVRQCHMLFLVEGEEASVPRVLSRLRGQPVLLVSEVDGFAQRGGMIEFVTDQKKIKLKINVESAHAADLVISSKLLRVAEVFPKP